MYATLLHFPAALLSQRRKVFRTEKQKERTSKKQSRKYIQCLGDWHGGGDGERLWGETDENLEQDFFLIE